MALGDLLRVSFNCVKGKVWLMPVEEKEARSEQRRQVPRVRDRELSPENSDGLYRKAGGKRQTAVKSVSPRSHRKGSQVCWELVSLHLLLPRS